MAKVNVVAPSVGESITEVSILKWAKQSGQAVKVGELLLEIESDKATVEVVAEVAGVLTTLKNPGERVLIGAVIATIDTEGKATVAASAPASTAPAAKTPSAAPAAPASASAASTAAATGTRPATDPAITVGGMGPAARKAALERGVNPFELFGTGKDGRVTKGDALNQTPQPKASSIPYSAPAAPQGPTLKDGPGDRRVPMSMLRSKIAERLVHAQHTAAILTTFNEVDMSAVIAHRNKNKDAFKAKHGVPLSFMSYFTMASIAALKVVPEVNATCDYRDTVYHDYFDIGIAVGTERGLVVPVIRGADKLGVVGFEKALAALAEKARTGKLSMADLSGGTFTISNGGTYGSLNSTPILNYPQAGILGMHKTQDRPVAVNGKVEIRPMMYLALSYDHRIIDGKGAVTFLVTLKEHLEDLSKLNLDLGL